MSRILKAEKPGRRHVTPIIVEEEVSIPLGGEGKSYIEASLNENSTRRLQLVWKRVLVAAGTDNFIQQWRAYKEAGVATIPSVRKISDSEVLMTNLTRDGSAFYGKAARYASERDINLPLQPMDHVFMNINLDPVIQEAQRMADILMQKHVYLPYDDPFDLLVHPNGSWEVLIMDIDSQGDDDDIEKYHSRQVNAFRRHLSIIRDNFQKRMIKQK
jgi:hypothetical protein